MSNEPKTTQEEPSNPSHFSCCGDMTAMREKMAGQKMQGWDCAGMMARIRALFGKAKSETAAPEELDTPNTVV